MTDTKRLATDAAYWDEIARDSGCVSPGTPPTICGIPRPTKPVAPEWDGEPLLPPVGAVILSDTTGHSDVKFRVTGYHVHEDLKGSEYLHRVFVDLVYLDDPTVTNARMLRDIRPLRTKEQRQREELAKVLADSYDATYEDCLEAAEAAIAAGWTKP